MEPGGDGSPGSAAMIPGVRAHVETVLLSTRAGQLCFRTVSRPLGTGEHPDACARSLAGHGVRLLHSTSWRHTLDGIVLTYVALPDPDPGRAASGGSGLTARYARDSTTVIETSRRTWKPIHS